MSTIEPKTLLGKGVCCVCDKRWNWYLSASMNVYAKCSRGGCCCLTGPRVGKLLLKQVQIRQFQLNPDVQKADFAEFLKKLRFEEST